MRTGLVQEGVALRFVPMASTFLFAILSMVPLHVPGLAVATPAFVLMAVYHWTIYRPDLLPASGVFCVGLFLDLLNGTPYVGVSSLMLLTARIAVLASRRHLADRPFPLIWAGMLAVAAAAACCEWMLTSLLTGVALGSRPFLSQAVLSAASFPVVTYFLAQIQRAVLPRD